MAADTRETVTDQTGQGGGSDCRGRQMILDDAKVERFSRQILLPEIGAAGQERLLARRALLAGLEPVVATAALYLAGAGIGSLGLADAAAVGPNDLDAPLVFNEAVLGMPRAHVVAAMIRSLNPDANPILVTEPERAFDGSSWDLVLCADTEAAGVDAWNAACLAAAVPLLVAHVHPALAWLAIVAGVATSAPCWSCVCTTNIHGPERDHTAGAPTGPTAICAGILGTLAATEIIKLLLALPGAEPGLLVTYAPADGSILTRALAKNPQCNVCRRPPTAGPEAGD